MPADYDAGDERELRELVATAGRILYQQGLVDYLGHVSHRVDGTDRVIIKPKFSTRTRGHHSVTAADLVVIDLDGRPVEGTERPPAEVFIHTEIYRARPDVASVVHTHQRTTTLMGVVGAPILPVLHVPSALLDDVDEMPTWPSPLLVTSPERGRQVAAALGAHHACHLQGHGIVAVAPDIKTATVRAVMLEELAQVSLAVAQTGCTPRVITPDERRELQRESGPVAGRWAYYKQLGPADGEGDRP
jgi:ribulose-5-phosphate 4-epimerase/fuculose-1-phosphate aldolase